MSVTTKTIADAAGVSLATVSRVMNKMPGVGEDTAQLVRATIDRVGYQRPSVRRGPKPRSHRILQQRFVALITAGQDPTPLYKAPVFPSLLVGIERALAAQQLRLALIGQGGDDRLSSALNDDRLEGVLMVGPLEETMTPDGRAWLNRLPAVWLVHEHGNELGNFDRVVYNNPLVGELAARHLLNKGHKNLAFLNAMSDHPGFARRQKVFIDACHAAGANVREFIAPDPREATMAAFQKLLSDMARMSPLPTGLFVPNDRQLPALYMALANHRIVPGKDVEIISCDNESLILDQFHPTPTSIDLNWGLVGERGVQQLLWRRKHPDEQSRVTITIDPFIPSRDPDLSSGVE